MSSWFVSPFHADKRWASTRWDCTSPFGFHTHTTQLWAWGSFSPEKFPWPIQGATDFQSAPTSMAPRPRAQHRAGCRTDRQSPLRPSQTLLVGRVLPERPGGIVRFVGSAPAPPPPRSSPHGFPLTAVFFPLWLCRLQARYHLCSAGWLDSERVGYPTAFSSPNCGSGYVGIVDYGRRGNLSETWDVFCYREKGKWVLRSIPPRKGQQQPRFRFLWSTTAC